MILIALGLGLLGAVVGCSHTAGRCDCDAPPASVLRAEPPPARGTWPVMLRADSGKDAPKADLVKDAPKADSVKDAPKNEDEQ
jgi:hypothetical protein